MAQHNCEDLKPTDTPSAVPTTLQASSDHTFNPKCAHNLMTTQCNQSQHLALMKQICAHNPSSSQVSQTNPSNSLASPYPPDPGEHVLKRFATEVGEQDFPVKWFKFIHPSPKPRMTETPVHKLVHVAYSPITSMSYQWTINLHDEYPLLKVMQPEEYIPPFLHTLCNLKPTMFHLGDDYLCPTKILPPPPPPPPGDNGENLEAAANEENEINNDLYKFRALDGHQQPPWHETPIEKSATIMSLLNGRLGRRPSVLAADDQVTYDTYVKENDLLHIEGWKRFRNLAKRDKHDLSSLASPKGEMKSSFSWTSLFKSPKSSTLCFGEPTLGKLKQVKLLCSPTSSTLCDSTLAKLKQVKLLCSPTSSTLCDPTLAKLNQETELCITKYSPLCDSVVHTGTNFSVP